MVASAAPAGVLPGVRPARHLRLALGLLLAALIAGLLALATRP